MKRVNVEQGSSDWIDLRRKHLGASDVSCVLELSPWKTPYQLWEEKTGRGDVDISDKKKLFAIGHEKEAIARTTYESKVGYKMNPAVIKNPKYNFFLASLDGFNEEQSDLIEVKYMGADKLNDLSNGIIPNYYYTQLQMQMLMTGLDEMKLIGVGANNEMIVQIVQFNGSMANQMVSKCLEFWDFVKKDSPPKLTEKDFREIEDAATQRDIEEYLGVVTQIEILTSMKDDLRKRIQKSTNGHRSRYKNMTIQTIRVKGRIDYSSIKELESIDLEQYRKPDTEVFRINID